MLDDYESLFDFPSVGRERPPELLVLRILQRGWRARNRLRRFARRQIAKLLYVVPDRLQISVYILHNQYSIKAIRRLHAILISDADRSAKLVNYVAKSGLSRETTSELRSIYLNSLFELGRFAEAATYLDQLPPETLDSGQRRLKAHLLLLNGGDEDEARSVIWTYAWNRPNARRPHQNLASREDMQSYVPNDLDFQAGAEGAFFDTCNYLGQRAVHVGRGELAIPLYAKALQAQNRLRQEPPQISTSLAHFLKRWGLDLNKLRIAPPEWSAQIGHMGFLDFLLRMRTLGWWQGDLLILARPDIIANKPCLSLFDKFAKIIIKDRDVSSPVWDELCSLQRWLGLNFNACPLPDGQIANWPDASAFVAQHWAQQWPDQFPLKKEYEVRFANDPRVVSVFDEARRSWGMNKTDWFVCLHMRDANFYAEHQSAGQTHRNSDFDPYRQAIEYIISLGGWVIRMGSASARPLPQMRGLIDYARSPFKCAILDLHLLYSSRFFIGTTSGLGNIANSFGVPMALVNCITVDGQLWHNRVRFVLKQVLRGDGPPLSQREFTNDCRWRLFAQEPLRQDGLIPCDSSTDEIFEIVKEVEEISKTGATEPKSDEERALLGRWRNSLAIPYFYGASQPSRYYLKKYRETFLQPGSSESN